MNDLTQQRILVTGAGSGLGAAIAARLVKAGARVALLDIRADSAERVALATDPGGGATLALGCDVGQAPQVQQSLDAVLDRWGGLDVLVNNAGTDVTASIDEVDSAVWRKVIDTNLVGPFLLTKAALPMLRASDGGRGGHIVNVASTASLRAWPNASAYHASKWGLLGMGKALHAELRPQGVRVTTLIVGGMRTPFLLDRFPDIDTRTLQDPANVAEAVGFVLAMPRGTVIAEIMVLPDAETSWP
ncbi:SDR family oxidoreductase [Hydrogenophaga pseudoflava]|uniref:SDR family oxidoreductase n=1 Tax=Hydrogenophaga pseudoflava TaxID=47421 RepID=UPI0027E57A09|nr:SDR family oxidoreductase [Hydrogenophaga pseudoflava]MDQ7744395.1 SDR family oxidoreductase [Hydrogenophaga pseudoflava]